MNGLLSFEMIYILFFFSALSLGLSPYLLSLVTGGRRRCLPVLTFRIGGVRSHGSPSGNGHLHSGFKLVKPFSTHRDSVTKAVSVAMAQRSLRARRQNQGGLRKTTHVALGTIDQDSNH